MTMASERGALFRGRKDVCLRSSCAEMSKCGVLALVVTHEEGKAGVNNLPCIIKGVTRIL